MTKNLIDKGEQVCQMQLLLKDHKDWSEESGKAIPSRPVVSGNNGLNCHLSELVSLLIEPVAFEHSGSEVDSTDDMLAKINELNSKLSDPRKTKSESNESECFEDTVEIMNTDKEKSLNSQEICRNPEILYPKGDIRNFGVKGKITTDSSKASVEKRLKDKIESLRFKRKGESLLPDIAERFTASSLIDSLNGDE